MRKRLKHENKCLHYFMQNYLFTVNFSYNIIDYFVKIILFFICHDSVAKNVESLVRSNGAIPATVAVLDGKIHVGKNYFILFRNPLETSGSCIYSHLFMIYYQ